MRRGAVGALGLAAVGVLAACVPAEYGSYSPAAGRAATPAEAPARTAGGHLTWRVFDVGSLHVRCTAPAPVRSEFALHC